MAAHLASLSPSPCLGASAGVQQDALRTPLTRDPGCLHLSAQLHANVYCLLLTLEAEVAQQRMAKVCATTVAGSPEALNEWLNLPGYQALDALPVRAWKQLEIAITALRLYSNTAPEQDWGHMQRWFWLLPLSSHCPETPASMIQQGEGILLLDMVRNHLCLHHTPCGPVIRA